MIVDHAAWRHRSSGIEERACFLELEEGMMMLHLHLPLEVRGAVVICGPTDREQMRHYRRQALLARQLAGAGIAVARFDYRGTGNSDPLVSPFSLDTMEKDIAAVVDWFVPLVGADRLGLVAESLASLPAARVARDHPRGAVALVEPVIRPASFYRQLQRTRLVAEARDGGSEWPLRKSLTEALQESGWADILGYRLDASAYDAAVARDLVSDLGPGADRPVLIVQVDKRDELRPELSRLAERLRSDDFAVDCLRVKTEHAWWYIPEWLPETADEENVELLPGLSRWFTTTFSQPPLDADSDEIGERL